MSGSEPSTGQVIRIAGPVVSAAGLDDVRLYDVVHVGKMGLIGEVIRLSKIGATIQVYEDTTGLSLGEPVTNLRQSLVAQLGPGLLGSVYDGLQRPLKELNRQTGIFIHRGVNAASLPQEITWIFTPALQAGARVAPGDVLGTVPETDRILHRIMVPPDCRGNLTWIGEGRRRVCDAVAIVENGADRRELTLAQSWPVRRSRPYHARIDLTRPLITGTRVIDTFFPVAKGGTAIIPGGFGTGKTVLQHTLSRWADTDVVVYVGCGERGNEMTEVLEEFPASKIRAPGNPSCSGWY
jgi:V/A-type H+-transporting ATPase subunit A